MIEPKYSYLTSKRSAVLGWISGTFIFSGLYNPFGPAAQAILFVVGVIIFLDSVVNRIAVNIYTTIIFGILGAIAYFAAALSGISATYLILIIVLCCATYIYRGQRLYRKGRAKK